MITVVSDQLYDYKKYTGKKSTQVMYALKI